MAYSYAMNEVLDVFFRTAKSTLFRSLEINEMVHDSQYSKEHLGQELTDKFNKVNSEYVANQLQTARDLIKQSLQVSGESDV